MPLEVHSRLDTAKESVSLKIGRWKLPKLKSKGKERTLKNGWNIHTNILTKG